MADEIVANALVAARDLLVEFVALLVLPRLEEGFGCVDDDVQRGRLERLEKALRQADREAVSDPTALNPSAAHLQVPDLGVFAQTKMPTKLRRGSVAVDVARRIDVTVPDAVGERDVPHPS